MELRKAAFGKKSKNLTVNRILATADNEYARQTYCSAAIGVMKQIVLRD